MKMFVSILLQGFLFLKTFCKTQLLVFNSRKDCEDIPLNTDIIRYNIKM